jgi:hypothetical protein
MYIYAPSVYGRTIIDTRICTLYVHRINMLLTTARIKIVNVYVYTCILYMYIYLFNLYQHEPYLFNAYQHEPTKIPIQT